MLTGAINALSNNRYSKMVKRHSYDGYFHLGMVFQTKLGPLVIEKNESVHLAAGDPSVKGTQALAVNFPATTVKNIMDNVRRAQGNKFFKYDAKANNCQQFIKDLLVSNGIHDPTILTFVRQDTESIFKNQPGLRRLANSVTDAANVVMGVSQMPRLLQRKVEQHTRRPLRAAGRTISRGVRRLFGGAIGQPKLLVKDLKAIIKQHKHDFDRPIRITGMKKAQLEGLVLELQAKGLV